MKLAEAIAYLEDKTIPTADRFKVVTGWDSKANAKHATNRWSWMTHLTDTGLLTKLVIVDAVASPGNFFHKEDTFEHKLKVAYKLGIESSHRQKEHQEAYLELVLDFVKKYQDKDLIKTVTFTEPAKIIALVVTPAQAPACN